MIIVKDKSGAQEPLLVNSLHVTEELGVVAQLDFVTENIPENEAAYKMIQPRSIFVVPETGEQYRISENDGETLGNYYQRTVTALQVLQDLDEHVVRTTIKGIQSLDAVMHFLTDGTAFYFTIHDSVANFDFGDDEFGQDHALGLFTDTVVANYGIEFTCTGYHIDIYKKVGARNKFVFLSGDDLYALQDSGEYTQIRTRIYGTGKTDDNGNPTVTAEYTSPSADIYGVIDDDIFTDDTVTDQATLIAKMKAKLVDYPLIQYTATVNKFEKNKPAGLSNDSSIGNYGFVRDRNGLDVETRVIQRDYYPQSTTEEDSITFGDFKLDPVRMLNELKNNHTTDMKQINALKESQSKAIDALDDIDLSATKVGEVND